jgi:hypothetical protein
LGLTRWLTLDHHHALPMNALVGEPCVSGGNAEHRHESDGIERSREREEAPWCAVGSDIRSVCSLGVQRSKLCSGRATGAR